MNTKLRCFLLSRVLPCLIFLGAGLLLLLLLGRPAWHPAIRQCQRLVFGPGLGISYDDGWGDKRLLTRDLAGRVIDKDNRTGRARWLWAFDDAGRVIAERSPTGTHKQWTYDEASGLPVRYKDSWGTKIQIEYGPDGKPKAQAVGADGVLSPIDEAVMPRILPPKVDAEGRRDPPMSREEDQPLRIVSSGKAN